MSSYALLAAAWGAEVRGWDRVRTPYLDHLPEQIGVDIAADPPKPPRGWEVYVSTAFVGRVAGRQRADLLAELTSLRDTIVVAGAHGKTTTAAMIAFALREVGADPAWLIGADVPPELKVSTPPSFAPGSSSDPVAAASSRASSIGSSRTSRSGSHSRTAPPAGRR